MAVTVRLFAGLRERAGVSRMEIDGVERVSDVWAKLDLGEEPGGLLYALNRAYVERDAARSRRRRDRADSAGLRRRLPHRRRAARHRCGDRRGGEPRCGRSRVVRRHRAAPFTRPRRAVSGVRGVRGDGGADARPPRRRAHVEAPPVEGRDPSPRRPRGDRRGRVSSSPSRRRIARPRSTPAARRSTR